MNEWNTVILTLVSVAFGGLITWLVTNAQMLKEKRQQQILHGQKICLILAKQLNEFINIKEHFFESVDQPITLPLIANENNWRMDKGDILQLLMESSKTNLDIVYKLMFLETHFIELLSCLDDYSYECKKKDWKHSELEEKLISIHKRLNSIKPYELQIELHSFLKSKFTSCFLKKVSPIFTKAELGEPHRSIYDFQFKTKE